MRGRKRKPTAIHLLNGNPGKRALPDAEPHPVGPVVMPEWLSPDARQVWDELAPGLLASRVLTAADVPALAMVCDLDSRYRKAPAFMTAAEKGLLKSLWSEFGMTPSSRSRVRVGKEKPLSDESRFFA